VSMCM